MIHHRAQSSTLSSDRRENTEEQVIFSFVAETPTNETHHASGNRLRSKPCPEGVDLFLDGFYH